MKSDFSNILSQLRCDKFLSQRKVAEDLNISQALLSHYENGIREPRLEFVIKACAYYGVSSDYILGLSTVRSNPLLIGIDKPENEYDRATLLHANDEMHKLVSTLVLLFGLLAESGKDDYISAASLYIGTAIYKVFRDVYPWDTENELSLFKVPSPAYIPLGDAVLMVSELLLTDKVRNAAVNGHKLFDMTEESLKERFPALYNALLETIENTECNILKYLE